MSASDFGTRPAGEAVEPCPLKKRATGWIEIEVVGVDDSPAGGVEYRVSLPNGDVARGYLDDDGWARVDGIDPEGTCKVSFPELDAEAWSYVEAKGPRGA